jgi:PKD repeat protein
MFIGAFVKILVMAIGPSFPWSRLGGGKCTPFVVLLLITSSLVMVSPSGVAGESRASGEWTETSVGLPTSGTYFGVAFGHIDKDGNMDVVASADGDGLRVFLGNGKGVWTPVTTHPETTGGFSGLCLADYDKDGNMDIFAGSPGAEDLNPNGLHMYRGDGTGNFTDETASSGLPTTGSWRGCTLGDVNKDGHLDLAATSGYGSSDGIHVFTGDGAGHFTDESTGLPSNQDRDSNIVLADFDKDGNMDLAAGGRPGPTVYLGNGGNGGAMAWTLSSIGLPNTRCAGISAADVNEDGLVDLVFTAIEAGPGGGIYAYENVREASLWRSISTGLPGSGDYVENAIGDYDGDTHLDIAATGGIDDTYGIHLYEGNGDGSWAESSLGLPSSDYYVGIAQGDFDADGNDDLIAGKRTGGGGVEVWRNPRGASSPSVSLVSPSGGQLWTGGSQHEVRWAILSGTPPYSVTLRYSTDGGSTFTNTIVEDLEQSEAGVYTHKWTLPVANSSEVKVSIDITDADSRVGHDASLATFEIDSTPPIIVDTVPMYGSMGVLTDTILSVTFDEAMNHSIANAFSIEGPGDPILTGAAWDGNRVTFQTSGLERAGFYTVTVSTQAKDASDPGNFMVTERSILFGTIIGGADSPPVADAGDDRTIDQHQELTFDGTGSTDDTGIAEWRWQLIYDNQGVTLKGPSPTFVFDKVGIYEVSLSVADDDGFLATDQMFVTVTDVDPPQADAGDKILINQHQTLAFDGGGSSDNVDITFYEWSFEYDGTIQTLPGERPTFMFDLAGSYNVTLTVGDAEGNMGTATVNVTVRDTEPPVAVTIEVKSVREGTNVTIDGTASTDNVGIVAWNWTIELKGEVVSLEGDVVSFKFKKPGVYQVTLTVSDAMGLDDSDRFEVKVKEKSKGPGLAGAVTVLAIVMASLASSMYLRRVRNSETHDRR